MLLILMDLKETEVQYPKKGVPASPVPFLLLT